MITPNHRICRLGLEKSRWMMRAAVVLPTFLAVLTLSGCDPAPRWTSGNYEVYSMDVTGDLEFGVDVGGVTQGMVNPRVVAVGEDSMWIVVKRHPDGDRTRAEYFYLRKQSHEEQRKGLNAIQGPFSGTEFEQKAKDLKLPSFSWHS